MDKTTTEEISQTRGKDFGLDIQRIREDFPMLKTTVNGKQMIYFDSAATNYKPQCVIDRLSELYSSKYAKTQESHTFSEEMTQLFEETRAKVAKFVNAKEPDEIVFTTGSTQGINMVANGFARAFLRQDDEIIISHLEHHSNIVPWQLACQITGAKLIVTPIDDSGELDMHAFQGLISEKTKIISLCHSSNVLGTIFPVQEITKIAHAKGIPVLIDGAQAAPHMPVDMQEIDCDFYTFSMHKMGGPAGVGILYGKAEWLDKLPPQLGGEGMAATVTFEESTYEPAPKKFEAGTPPFEEIVACSTLIDYVIGLDFPKTAEYESKLMEYGTQRLSEVKGLKIFGSSVEKEPVIAFEIEGLDVKNLEKYLNEEYNIAVKAGPLSAQPLMKRLGVEGLLRVAFCYFNTYDEIDLLVEAVDNFVKSKMK